MKLPTPSLFVDVDVFEANLKAAETLVTGTGKRLRPHFKTHRTPGLAIRQLNPTVVGFTCATVGEAETLVYGGLDHILLANEVVSPDKIATLARLALRCEIIVAVDAREPLRALERACEHYGSEIGILVDVNIGLNRCGVDSLEEAQNLAEEAASAPHLRFRGLMGYEGRIRSTIPNRRDKIKQAFEKLSEVKNHLEARGIPVEMVSAGGTSTLPEALAEPSITEIQAGSYCLMEPDITDLGLPFHCAVWVSGTVISRRPGRVVLDVGRRSIGTDHGLPIPEPPDATVVAVNDEHTILVWEGPLPELGSEVRLRPTQNRTTFNLHEIVYLVRNDQVIDVLPILARGRS